MCLSYNWLTQHYQKTALRLIEYIMRVISVNYLYCCFIHFTVKPAQYHSCQSPFRLLTPQYTMGVNGDRRLIISLWLPDLIRFIKLISTTLSITLGK